MANDVIVPGGVRPGSKLPAQMIVARHEKADPAVSEVPDETAKDAARVFNLQFNQAK